MTLEQFTTELKYVRNVFGLYACTFKAFAGALGGRDAIVRRIAEMRDRGVKAVKIDTYLRCLNAYFHWLRTGHGQALLKIPKLKEEQKVLNTFTAQHTRAIVLHRPNVTNPTRACMVALVILDCGLRMSEALDLRLNDLDFAGFFVRRVRAYELLDHRPSTRPASHCDCFAVAQWRDRSSVFDHRSGNWGRRRLNGSSSRHSTRFLPVSSWTRAPVCSVRGAGQQCGPVQRNHGHLRYIHVWH
jgi:integrase